MRRHQRRHQRRTTLTAAGALSAALALSIVSLPGGSATAAPGGSPNGSERRQAAVARANDIAESRLLGRSQDAVVRDVVLDRDGASHVRFDRTYRGLDVVGGDFVVHQDASGDVTTSAAAGLSTARTASRGLSVVPTISAPRAADLAASRVGYRVQRSTPELVVLSQDAGDVLAYRVNVEGRAADGSPQGTYVFVGAGKADAGRTVARWASEVNTTAQGTGNGLFVGTVPLTTDSVTGGFQMVDPSRGGNATYNGPYSSASTKVFTDADNVWGNGSTSDPATTGADAHFGIATTWDFYKSTYGRNGIANDGKGARSYVHDGAYVNASWSDACFCMKYGDGDSTTYPLVELDIAGHEMTHGVTSRTANLAYRAESGGLNEATSDIMGTMVEFYANNAGDTPDYVIGEEIYRSYNPATNYVRRMDKPSMDGGSLDCYSRRAKSVDVHYSSGIANHFFYLLSEGSGAKTINGVAYNSPTCNGSTVTGIGHDQAGAIWYRALTVYMTSTTAYSGARTATVQAATDLYGASSAQVAAVKSAWSAVSVA